MQLTTIFQSVWKGRDESIFIAKVLNEQKLFFFLILLRRDCYGGLKAMWNKCLFMITDILNHVEEFEEANCD